MTRCDSPLSSRESSSPGSLVGVSVSETELGAAMNRATAHENRRRGRTLGPLLAGVHLVHFCVFRWSSVGGTAPAVVDWRERLTVAHGTAAFVCIAAGLLGRRGPLGLARFGMPAVATFYLLFGAWVASIDQLVTPAITPYVIVTIGVAVTLHMPRVVALFGFTGGIVALDLLTSTTQPDPSIRTSVLLNGLTTAALGFGLSLNLRRTTARRVRQRALIDAQNEALARLASQDALTELPNRRVFSHALSEAMRQLAEGHEFTVALLDLDHFKRVNDQFGHPVGDEVLRETAEVIRDSLRTDDVAARLGGEEFGVLLSGVSGDEAHQVLDALRERLADHPMTLPEIRVTTSIGHTRLDVADGDDARAALRRADEALYAAKSSGRNRVIAR